MILRKADCLPVLLLSTFHDIIIKVIYFNISDYSTTSG